MKITVTCGTNLNGEREKVLNLFEGVGSQYSRPVGAWFLTSENEVEFMLSLYPETVAKRFLEKVIDAKINVTIEIER